MPRPVEKVAVERSLDASIKDGAAYAVMVGIGETYVPACALFLGASRPGVALLVSIPLFLGACSQLVSVALTDRTGRRKGIIVAAGVFQGLLWIPMVLSLWTPPPWGFRLLAASFALYFVANHLTLPPWVSLMGDLVPAGVRGRYFGRRSAVALLMQTLAAVVGGLGLWVYDEAGDEAAGFAVVFAGALLARAVSIGYIARMAEPPYVRREEDRFTLWQFLRRLPRSNFAKFVFFVACMNAGANFIGCLFIPYMRDVLRYSYWEFAAAMAAIMVSQIPALPFWGRIADRYGNKKVLTAAALGITVFPLLWFFSTHVVWACALQLWSGFFWSGFNQSVSNFLLDAVSPAKRARCTAYLNLIANAGLLAGGLAGAALVDLAPDRIGPVRLPYAIWSMFFISFLLRLGTLVVFLGRFREVRDVPKIGVAEMLFHATREATESALNVMTGWVARKEDEEDPGAGVSGSGGAP
jgi:MFS family permease